MSEMKLSNRKNCLLFVGDKLAESILNIVFDDVDMMSERMPGYFFICGKEKKIEVCRSCIQQSGGWKFSTNRNTIADYFLCMAFEDKEYSNILYAWLLPGDKFCHLTGTGISPKTINKWNRYEIDIDMGDIHNE